MTAAMISSRHRSTLALVLALVATFATFPAAASAETDIFSASCLPSHVANDDPIVFPGMPGAAHCARVQRSLLDRRVLDREEPERVRHHL